MFVKYERERIKKISVSEQGLFFSKNLGFDIKDTIDISIDKKKYAIKLTKGGEFKIKENNYHLKINSRQLGKLMPKGHYVLYSNNIFVLK